MSLEKSDSVSRGDSFGGEGHLCTWVKRNKCVRFHSQSSCCLVEAGSVLLSWLSDSWSRPGRNLLPGEADKTTSCDRNSNRQTCVGSFVFVLFVWSYQAGTLESFLPSHPVTLRNCQSLYGQSKKMLSVGLALLWNNAHCMVRYDVVHVGVRALHTLQVWADTFLKDCWADL